MVTITFEQPQYLWLLLALPLLAITHFFMLRHAKRKALRFANFAAIRRATGERLITKNYWILILRLCILLFIILATAQAVLWHSAKVNQNEYVIAIDTSASMSAQDIPPSRIEAAKSYAIQFADDLRPNTLLGLVSFSGVTFIEQPLSKDRSSFRESLERTEISASGTDIAGAIITSTNLLATAERGRAIILITDGSNTIETFQSDSLTRAATYARVNRVKIYTIGVGVEDSSPIGYLPSFYNVSASYNDDNLISIANATGGKHFRAESAGELSAAYEEIRSGTEESILRRELSAGLVLVALVLILIEWGLMSTRFRAFP